MALLWRIGSYNYGDCVPRYIVNKMGTQESWWHEFQYECCQAQDARRANVSGWIWRLGKPQISAHTVRQEEFPLPQPFCSTQVFHWMRPTHVRESILLSLPIQMLSPSRITPYKLIQCNVWPNVWASCSLVVVTQIDHHSPYLGICVKILMAAGTILFIM